MKNLGSLFLRGGVWIVITLLFLIPSCKAQSKETPVPTLALSAWLSTPTPPSTTLLTPEPKLQPTGVQKTVLFLLPPNPSADIQSRVAELRKLAQADGLQVNEKPGNEIQEIPADTQYAVIFGSWDGADAIVKKYQKIPFLTYTDGSLSATENVTFIPTGGLSADQIDFLAGYLSAVVTPHWRVAVIAGAESPSRARFVRGAVFFCGFCRPPYPPFEGYPMEVQLDGEQNVQAAVDQLVQAEVKTVYVAPGSESQTLFDALNKATVNIISTQRAPEGMKDHWVVSLQGGGNSVSLEDTWRKFVQQEPQGEAPNQAIFMDVNPGLFSPGRQVLVKELVRDLESGKISPDN